MGSAAKASRLFTPSTAQNSMSERYCSRLVISTPAGYGPGACSDASGQHSLMDADSGAVDADEADEEEADEALADEVEADEEEADKEETSAAAGSVASATAV